MTQPSAATSAPLPGAAWPPPGLEMVHGRVWSVVGVLAFADLVLGLPLLATLATDAPYWSLGPFGDIWWLPVLTTLIGGVMLAAGLGHLVGLFRRAQRAANDGHGWRTILYAATDRSRDAGFLLQRARGYAILKPAERDTILQMRVLTALLVLAAVLTAPSGLAATVLLGKAGGAGEAFLTFAAFTLPLTLLGAGAAASVAERWAARRAGRGVTPSAVDTIGVVGAWNRALGALDKAPSTGAPKAGPFRLGFYGAVALTFLILVPITTLVMVGAVAQILASQAMPVMSSAAARLASMQPLRHYRPAPVPGITPTAAGEALNSLISAGGDTAGQTKVQRAPVRAYHEPWWPKDAMKDSLIGGPKHTPAQLFQRAARFTAAERAYLAKVAAHPAHAEFRTVAGAKTVDVIATRYVLPFPADINVWALPIPRYVSVRDGVRAHLARAALELSQGHAAEAEATVREVIGMGFVMRDHGPTLIDNLIGIVIARDGGDALEALYRATGRSREADQLQSLRDQVAQAVQQATPAQRGGDPAGIEAGLHAMALVAVDSMQPPGFRWEYFGIVNTLAPCVSLKRLVFGPGDSFREWSDAAHKGLVHNAGDEQMFQLQQRGPFGAGRCVPPLWAIKAMRGQ